MGVALVVHLAVLGVIREHRRWDVETATPLLELLRAVLLESLRLVEPLQRPVVALVEPPAALDRNPEAIRDIQSQIGRLNRARQDTRVQDVRLQS